MKPERFNNKKGSIMYFDDIFCRTLGKVINHEGMTFSPGLIAEEISRETGKPEEEVLAKVIEQCKELVELHVLWFSSSHLYMKGDSCLTVSRLRELYRIISGAGKEIPISS